ncbi:fimbrial protein [uncultured Bacteroides sp.]|uniref:fimbrial protein n=1 Tax=uncultured Bacteroides sp. TaxID=162156 RepID=UPI002AA6646E|nr:fimbrial protein [uncultured Bacteroides sp.]
MEKHKSISRKKMSKSARRTKRIKTVLLVVFVSALIGLAIPLLSACSGDANAPEQPTNEKNASLQLTVEGTLPESRASGSALPTGEDNIRTLAVGVFNLDGGVNVIAEPTLTGTTASTINCTAGTCNIVVVANAPSGTFAGVTTLDAFLNKTVSLGSTATSGVQTPDNLPMSGRTDGVVLEAGITAKTTVNLTRLVARISTSKVVTAFDANGQYIKATFKMDRIFLYDACGTSKVSTGDVSFTMPASPYWLSGGTVNGDGTWTAGTDYLLDDISPAESSLSAPHWFYTFANNSIMHPTKLVISGLFDADGAGTAYSEKRVYYPIVVNKAQTGTTIDGTGGGTSTIARNTNYTISVTLKGIGADSPEDDIEPVAVDLSVKVNDWELTFLQEVVVY